MPDPPTFIWKTVQGAASYKLEISLSDTYAQLIDSVTTNTIRYTSLKTFEQGTAYYWRVAMIDKDGNLGPFTGSTIYDEVVKIFIPVAIHN